jgi:hypothetical protein
LWIQFFGPETKIYKDLGAFATEKLAAYDMLIDKVYEAVANAPIGLAG